MITFNELNKQIMETPFKGVSFSIFNHIECDGFPAEMLSLFNIKTGIDDYEYIRFSMDETDVKGLKCWKRDYIRHFLDYKEYIEKDVQKDLLRPKLRVYLIRQTGSLIVVKLTDFNINDKLHIV